MVKTATTNGQNVDINNSNMAVLISKTVILIQYYRDIRKTVPVTVRDADVVVDHGTEDHSAGCEYERPVIDPSTS